MKKLLMHAITWMNRKNNYAVQTKTDIKEYVLYNFISLNMNAFILTEIRSVFGCVEGRGWD